MSKKAMTKPLQPDGWPHMASKKEVLCVHEAGDRQPASAPAGRGTLNPSPPRSQYRTQRRNWTPSQPFKATNSHWAIRLVFCELSGLSLRTSFFLSTCL